MPNYVCNVCGSDSDELVQMCPSCSGWQTYMPQVRQRRREALGDGAVKTAAELWGSSVRDLYLSGTPGRVFGRLPRESALVALYGGPGAGKSTLALRTADALAARGENVLYLAYEEGFGPTLRDRLQRLELRSETIYFTVCSDMRELAEKISELAITWVVIDSIGLTWLTADDLARMTRQVDVSVIFLLQATKAGLAAGSNALLHVADTVVRLEPDGLWFREKARMDSMAEGTDGWDV